MMLYPLDPIIEKLGGEDVCRVTWAEWCGKNGIDLDAFNQMVKSFGHSAREYQERITMSILEESK